jgi:hypothetical protein
MLIFLLFNLLVSMEGSKNLGTFSYSTTTLIVRLFSRVFGTSIESGNTYKARLELFYVVIRGMDCLVEVEPMLDKQYLFPQNIWA